MELENTKLNKEKFFMLYYHQFIVGEHSNKATTALNELDNFDINDAYLKLKSLRNITDADAIDFFDIVWGKVGTHKDKPNDFKIEFGKDWALSPLSERYGLIPSGLFHGVDFLRSKSYFLPYLGMSEEEATNRGWIKIIEQPIINQ